MSVRCEPSEGAENGGVSDHDGGKIVQFQLTDRRPTGHQELYVLLEDGTIWVCSNPNGGTLFWHPVVTDQVTGLSGPSRHHLRRRAKL